MALLTATDAALYLGVNRRSLGRQREALAERGLARLVGRRWMFESGGLKSVWLEVAHHQVANSENLDRLAREVKTVRAGHVAQAREFWAEFGRWAPDEPLSEAEAWEHTATIAAAMLGVGLTVQQVDELLHHLEEAAEDVRLGARWDAAAWASASARLEAEE